jgi:hypothetical protein
LSDASYIDLASSSVPIEDMLTTLDAHSGLGSLRIRGSETGSASYNALPTSVTWTVHTDDGTETYDNDDYRINGFRPSGETTTKYVISAWVKSAISSSNYQPDESIASIEVESFNGSTQVGSTASFSPKGNMIDGWMKIEGEVNIPTSSSIDRVKIKVIGGEHGTYLDDLRIYPSVSAMKSFVYDKFNHRLMCVLDENNFGTFYHYDEDGALKKLEKETLNGKLTIKESEKGNARL